MTSPTAVKPHTAGIVSALVTLSGLCLSPAVLNLVPAKYAAVVTALGVFLQAFTKPVTAGNTTLVPNQQ